MIDLVTPGSAVSRAKYNWGLYRRAKTHDAKVCIWLAMRAASKKKNRRFFNALHRVLEAVLLILGRF